MRSFNLFYIAVITVGLLLVLVLRPSFHREVSFFGFAENMETTINFNHPVVVKEVLVKPGQAVNAGDTLLLIARRPSKQELLDQDYDVSTLQAEASVWQQEQLGKRTNLRLQHEKALAELDHKILELEAEIAYKQSVVAQLKSVSDTPTSYQPLEATLQGYRNERAALVQSYEAADRSIADALAIGKNPYQSQIKRLQAEKEFAEAQIDQAMLVTAPHDGLVGNILCKAGEHISAFSSLMSFYEPHTGLIKGYIHEDLTLDVKLGDTFDVNSLQNDQASYRGVVIGLGSRIVEIPTRLRKIETFKSYGREVLIEIPKDNRFLQKEKVSAVSVEQRP